MLSVAFIPYKIIKIKFLLFCVHVSFVTLLCILIKFATSFGRSHDRYFVGGMWSADVQIKMFTGIEGSSKGSQGVKSASPATTQRSLTYLKREKLIENKPACVHKQRVLLCFARFCFYFLLNVFFLIY